jgi:hypothetical protein
MQPPPKYKPGSPPPHRLTLAQARAYVAARTGKAPSHQTLLNWTRSGVNGATLRVVFSRGTNKYAAILKPMRFTTAAWLDDFLTRAAFH